MTFKMEGSTGEMATDSLRQAASDVVENKSVALDRSPDASLMLRERNLLLLSVLYYLYGEEEWTESPDWTKVAQTIQNRKIPYFGDDFSSQACERRYNSLMENGYEVGVGSVTATLKPPRRLTPAQKRLWILASTSTDLVRTSKILDEQMRLLYKEEISKIERIAAGKYNMDSSELEPEDDVLPLEGEDEFTFEAIEMEKFAADVGQSEVMERIVGMQDVLALIKYCYEAVDNAVKKHTTFIVPRKETPVTPPPLAEPSPAKAVNCTDSSSGCCENEEVVLPKPEVVQEQPEKQEKPTVEPTVPDASYEDPEKDNDSSSSSIPTSSLSSATSAVSSPALPKLTEVCPSPAPVVEETPAPLVNHESESSSTITITEPEKSPQKQVSKSREKTPTPTEPVSKEVDVVIPSSPKIADPEPSPDPPSVPINSSSETNGNGEHSEKERKEIVTPEDDTTPDNEELNKIVPVENSVGSEENDCEEKVESKEKEEEGDVIVNILPNNIEFVDVDTSQSTIVDSSQSSTIEITFDEPEIVPKGKKACSKKGSSCTPLCMSPASSRTSSRIATPEPVDFDGESKRKPLSRQHSGSDGSSTLSLRSRRGNTPTTPPIKGSSVEKELSKDNTSSSCSSPSVTSLPIQTQSVESMEEEEVQEPEPEPEPEPEEESFVTPRSTPESPESKDLDSNTENRPKQPKVYTVKPPSPLSHVDPKIFELNDDEEDEELVAIIANVNKNRVEKNSSQKTYTAYSRRGRTISSENNSENNDEVTHSKRSTRRNAVHDDADDSGDVGGNNEDSPSKRLTRSSLKLHDAAIEEGESIHHTGSDKAVSESSFGGGKEKKPKQFKGNMRVRRLFDEKQRLYGDTDTEESLDGKRVTRARARTSTSTSEKRSKSTSRGDSEGQGESDPTPTRSTRSRVNTVTITTTLEGTVPTAISAEDEELKVFRKSALALLEKLMGNESFTAIQKYLIEDPSKILKQPLDFQMIKQRLEGGKIKGMQALQKDLTFIVLNTLMAHPLSNSSKEATLSFHQWCRSCAEEALKTARLPPTPKIDNSDVESLGSHEDSRSETTSSKPVSSGPGRRKRKRSTSENSEDFSMENKRRVTRTSVSSSSYQQQVRKTKHPISPDIVSANRVRH